MGHDRDTIVGMAPRPGKLALDGTECQRGGRSDPGEVDVTLEERKLEVLRAIVED